jgi:ABC-type uncharacterized transport system ATPase subunit
MSALVELRRATKEFRGVPAFKNVDLTLEKGEIHAIVGENGAGKSTVTKVLAGVYPLTAGEMLLDGKPVKLASPSEALASGIAMVFQETNLVPSMTVAQNIYLGDEKFFNRLRSLYIQAQRFRCHSISTSTRWRRYPRSAPARSRWSRSRARCTTMRASSSSTSRPRRSRPRRSSTSSILPGASRSRA